jgi:hypothetical protein
MTRTFFRNPSARKAQEPIFRLRMMQIGTQKTLSGNMK